MDYVPGLNFVSSLKFGMVGWLGCNSRKVRQRITIVDVLSSVD